MAAFETDNIDVIASPIPGAPTQLLVRWNSTWTTRCHQVYVNDKLTWYSLTQGSPNEVILGISQGQPITVVVGAVTPENAATDYSASLNFTAGIRKTLRFAADPNVWDIDDQALFYLEKTNNPAPGYIAANLISAQPIFPGGRFYWGYGRGGYGQGDYGYGGANAIGFGNGPFGEGGFGFGCDWCQTETEPLINGTWKAAVRVKDAAGNLDAGVVDVETIAVDGPPRPASDLTVDGLTGSGSSRQVTCIFTESPDL